MARVKVACAFLAASAIGVFMTACGGSSGTGTTPPPNTYTLTVDSANPATGVGISASPAGVNGLGAGETPYTLTYDAGTTVTLTAPPSASGGNTFSSWTGCSSTSGTNGTVCSVTVNSNTTVTANYAAPTQYTLTVDSLNPSSGVTVDTSVQGSSVIQPVTTPYIFTLNAGVTMVLTAPSTSGANTFSSWTGCTTTSAETCSVTLGANTTVTANYSTPAPTPVAPTVSVTPASNSITTEQSLQVTVSVTGPAGDPTPTGSIVLSSGSYTSGAVALASGAASVTIPADALALGSDTLTATYTPDANGAIDYLTATGSHAVTETAIAPTVTVTPASGSIGTSQSLQVTIAVAAPSGDPTPTGSVVLTGGGYTSPSTTLANGSATLVIPAGSLSTGSDTLTANYTPDSASSSIYTAATGTSSAVNVLTPTTVSVDQSSVGPAVTDKILGVNLESWYDVVEYSTSVLSGLDAAGMQSLRWPGGSWSDVYHWNNGGTPYQCTCASATSCTANSQAWAGNADEAFASFENAISKAGSGLDLALTANYGTNETCNGGGDPSEAAAWAAAAVTNGQQASHITIGNEEYGSWETDLHASAHNPTTYADAVIGTSGYYDSIKNAITTAGGNPSSTLVGVVVDADCTTSSGCTNGWDTTMLPLAQGYYDFVEFHYYPEYQNGYDSNLIGTASPSYVQNFTADINTIKQELTTAGEPNTPIYVGEISSNSANGGTQNWSITQALYAGQILGEAMNDGVSRLTWWDGYGNCEGTTSLPPDNSTLYGWQDWGAQNIFSAGPSTDTGCPGDGAAGTLSPTAMAFQLFSKVAVTGENVLTASVSGDTTDVRAYSATHSGGTALVLFNLNKTTAEPVTLTLSSETSTADLQVMTYDKEMYDYTNVNCQADQTGQANGNNCTYDPTHNYNTVDWVQQPTTTDLGSQTLPYTLTLQPWSMNVVIVK